MAATERSGRALFQTIEAIEQFCKSRSKQCIGVGSRKGWGFGQKWSLCTLPVMLGGDVYFDDDYNNVDLGWVRMIKAGDGDDQNHPGWACSSGTVGSCGI